MGRLRRQPAAKDGYPSGDLQQERNRLANPVREQLWRDYPQALAISDDLAADWFLELWAAAPTPDKAARSRGGVEAEGGAQMRYGSAAFKAIAGMVIAAAVAARCRPRAVDGEDPPRLPGRRRLLQSGFDRPGYGRRALRDGRDRRVDRQRYGFRDRPVALRFTLASRAGHCYSPKDMQNAYGVTSLLNAGYTGKGQTIVIIDAFGSPTIAEDLHGVGEWSTRPAFIQPKSGS